MSLDWGSTYSTERPKLICNLSVVGIMGIINPPSFQPERIGNTYLALQSIGYSHQAQRKEYRPRP